MPSRVQYQFVTRAADPLGSGWTETFYSSLTPAETALEDSTDASWINARLKLMSDDFRLSQVKVVQVGLRTDRATKVYGGATGIGQFPPPAGDTFTGEQVWDAVLMSMTGVAGHLRNFGMRGIPTGVMQDTMTIAPGAWRSNFNQWVNLFTGQHGISTYQNRYASYSDSAFPVTATVVNGQRAIQLVYSGTPPVSYVRGALIRVTGLTGVNTGNHIWRIQDFIAPFTVVLYPGRRLIYGTLNAAAARTDLVTYRYDSIADIRIIRASKRNTGRPPALLRGVARVRRA
jgi:hypothetical protein